MGSLMLWIDLEDPEALERARRSRALFEQLLELADADRSRLISECEDRELAVLAERLVLGLEKSAAPVPVISFGALETPRLEVGRMLGRARIEGVLREGVNSHVYRGEHVETGRKLAVKVVGSPIVAGTVGARAARLLARLDHPGIVPVRDAGEIASSGGMAHAYLVMPLIEGRTLGAWWSERTRGPGEAARMIAEITDAVRHAHANLIVHRDLKPSNVLVDEEGRARVLDFGIAAVTTDALAAPGGTPAYMAPEQFDGVVDVRVDVYALGAMLHELVLGVPPVDVAGMEWDKAAAVKREAGELPARVDGVGRELAAVIAKSVATDPEARYQSGGELAADLRRAVEGRPVVAVPATARRRAVLCVRRSPVLFGLGLVAVLLLIGGVGGVWRKSVEAERSRGVASERFDLLREFTGWVVEDLDGMLASMAGSTAARAAIVDRAIESLDALRIGAEENPALRFEVAMARYRLARTLGDPLRRQLYRQDDAWEQCALAGELLVPLVDGGGYEATLLYARVRGLQYLVGVMQGREARWTILREGIGTSQRAIGLSSGGFEALALLAKLRALRVRMLVNNDELDDVRRLLHDCLGAIEDAERALLAESQGLDDLAWSCYYAAITCHELDEPGSLDLARRAEQLMIEVEREAGTPTNVGYAMMVTGDILCDSGSMELGLEHLRKTLAILDEEAASYPYDMGPTRSAEICQIEIADHLLDAAEASEGERRARFARDGLASVGDALRRYEARRSRGWVSETDMSYGEEYREIQTRLARLAGEAPQP